MEDQVRSSTQNAAFLTGPERSHVVLLCGPIAKPNQPANGGFQSANLRVSRVLKSLGFQVRHLYYPDSDVSAMRKAAAYMASFLKIYATLVASQRAILHSTPLGRHFILPELIAFGIARMFGHRIVCDIRAGNQRDEYDRRSASYRWLFRQMILLADVVSVENEEYLPFVEAIAQHRKAHVLPNFVPAEIVKRRTTEDTPTALRLAFVGRVNDAKGIPQTLKLHKRLGELLPAAELVVIGTGDRKYVGDLAETARDEKSMAILGPLEPSLIFQELDRSHFFVLLSAHSGEGHSNALTEAMARGCVPITTKHGFLEAVVGAAGLTFADRDDTQGIARVVADVWRSGAWSELSRRATSRVETRYTDVAVKSVILDMYRHFALQHQAT